MAANSYTFLDQWFIPHPIERVWEAIVHAEAYPTWWGEVYRRITPLNERQADQVGARAEVLAHGWLPYQLHFVSEITRVEPPYRLGLSTQGDLTGVCLWTLQSTVKGTAVSFAWNAQADKPLLRFFSPVLKPLFAWNHRWCMVKGEAALKRLLAEQGSPVSAAAS
jgi:uncharacterized protein YndB with AHSA1/START domain